VPNPSFERPTNSVPAPGNFFAVRTRLAKRIRWQAIEPLRNADVAPLKLPGARLSAR